MTSTDDPRSGPDLLDEALHAFRVMSIPDRPRDSEVLARLSLSADDALRSSRAISPSTKNRRALRIVLSCAAIIVIAAIGLAILIRHRPEPQPVEVATADPASPSANAAIQASTDMAMQAPPNIAREGLGSFDDGFAEAKAIVVATALDSTQAPPRRPGDLPENNIRFRVKRVIKGDLDQKEIFTRTPTAAAEFIGKDWIVVLSPDFLAGRNPYARHIHVEFESVVESHLPKDEE